MQGDTSSLLTHSGAFEPRNGNVKLGTRAMLKESCVSYVSIHNSANKGLPLPFGRGVCETKSKNGRSRPRKFFISSVFCAQRGIQTWSRKGPDHGVGVDPEILNNTPPHCTVCLPKREKPKSDRLATRGGAHFCKTKLDEHVDCTIHPKIVLPFTMLGCGRCAQKWWFTGCLQRGRSKNCPHRHPQERVVHPKCPTRMVVQCFVVKATMEVGTTHLPTKGFARHVRQRSPFFFQHVVLNLAFPAK